ncbi:MAG: hypothetical protein P9M13_00530 [Candidatus Ancaeobacter aquaticus]|nr:hypothetical protein [Candidatus Ancaeobacter aquaticus]
MLLLIKIISIVIICFGITFVISPKMLKKFVLNMKEGNKLYTIGVIRIFVGTILLLSASNCKWEGVIIVIGILLLIGGISIFAMGLERCRNVLDWYQERSEPFLRLVACLPILVGILILYSV